MKFKKLPIADLKAATYNPRKALKPGDKEYEKIPLEYNLTEVRTLMDEKLYDRKGCKVD